MIFIDYIYYYLALIENKKYVTHACDEWVKLGALTSES